MANQGGCFCGNIRYEFNDGDYKAANCHCARCRRHFCRDCGTLPVFESKERIHQLDINTCSLDDPEQFVPVGGAYLETRLRWLPAAVK